MKNTKPTNINTFLELQKKGNPVIDVRSPAEFANGHIPGAINIPLFSNKERAEIGTLYKQQGQETAVLRGLEIVGPKMADFVRQAKALQYQDQLLVHCWRGGMRSGSFGWLLNTAGLPAVTLAGGYKSYRNHLLEVMARPLQLYILTGYTGSGKTELLLKMKAKGEQVIDLEGLANHKGSVFGGMGQPDQPSSEQFQNELFLHLLGMDASRPIWLEDESISLGNVFIPLPLWHQMRKASLFHIKLGAEARVKRLVQEYGLFESSMLEGAIIKLTKRLGGQHAKSALEALQDNRLEEVAATLLTYYDKAYELGIEKRKELVQYQANYDRFDAEQITDDLIKYLWKISD